MAKDSRSVYESLDLWRGFAALWVVFFHATDVVFARDRGAFASWGYLGQFFGHGYLGVEVFFVISGYCIAAASASAVRNGAGVRAFLIARARRIFPPYWVALVLMTGLAGLVKALAARGFIPAAASATASAGIVAADAGGVAPAWPLVAAANVFLLQEAVHVPALSMVAWTLCYEVAFYLVCAGAVWLALRARSGVGSLLAGLHAVTVATLLVEAVLPGRLRYPLDMWSMFGVGVLVFDVLRPRDAATPSGANPVSGIRVRGRGVAMGAVLLLMAYLGFRASGQGAVGRMLHPAPLAYGTTVATGALLLLLRRWDLQIARSWVGKGFGRIGVLSYSLYLIHFTFLGVSNHMARILGVPPDWFGVRFAFLVTGALLGGGLLYVAVERPLLRAKGRSARAVPASTAFVSGAVAAVGE